MGFCGELRVRLPKPKGRRVLRPFGIVCLIRIPVNLLRFFHQTPYISTPSRRFLAIYKRSTCAVERRRSQLLALLAEGKFYVEVLAITQYSYQGADKIVDAYEA